MSDGVTPIPFVMSDGATPIPFVCLMVLPQFLLWVVIRWRTGVQGGRSHAVVSPHRAGVYAPLSSGTAVWFADRALYGLSQVHSYTSSPCSMKAPKLAVSCCTANTTFVSDYVPFRMFYNKKPSSYRLPVARNGRQYPPFKLKLI